MDLTLEEKRIIFYILVQIMEADAIEAAVAKVLKENYRTVDIMSEGMTECSTSKMGDLIADRI